MLCALTMKRHYGKVLLGQDCEREVILLVR
jgi:hypothetical protein